MNIECQTVCWDGLVPIKFRLSESDLTSSQSPNEVLNVYSRYSYLGQCSETVIEYFQLYTVDIKPELWFESCGLPLRSHLPVGVLFDVYSQHSIDSKSTTEWEITIHFNRFPYDKLLKSTNTDSARDYYYHSLKQALHLIHGSTQLFTSMTIENKNRLWEAICHGNFIQFQDMITALVPSYESIRQLPVRFILPTLSIVQRPIILNAHSSRSSGRQDDTASDVQSLTITSSNQLKLIDCILQVFPMYSSHTYNVIIQGITISTDMPIYDVWNILHHADLFLYVIIKEKGDEQVSNT